jgi:hypothetical protein
MYMATPQQNITLATETAEVLLNAIKEAAPKAQGRDTEGLESLARAYSLVREAMPRGGGSSGKSQFDK